MSEEKTVERTGFVGNVTEEQQKALDDLKARLVEKNIVSDDYECLRFLRARVFDVEKALENVIEYKEWFTKNEIATINQRPPPRADILTRLVPSAFYGFDKTGHPVYIERTGCIDCQLFMNQFTDNEIYMAHVWGQEKQIERCYESSDRLGLPRGSIESFTTILDLEGLTLGHRAMLKFSKLISEADQRFYPERMHKTIIVNPPGLFSFFWRLVKGWLDPVTRSKIVFCTEGNPELFDIIDRSQVPKRYGGEADVPGLENPDIMRLYETLCVDTHKPEDYSNHKLAAGTPFIQTVRMKAHDAYQWVFRGDDAVGFESYFRPDPVEGKQGPDRVVTSFSTVPADKIPNQGIFQSDEVGELFLVWKNENWFSAINLQYILEHAHFDATSTEAEAAPTTTAAPDAPVSAETTTDTSAAEAAVPE